MTRPRLMTTPFHLRTATHNGESAWRRCGKYSVAARYTNVFEEALAARISVIMADVTALPRIRICGSGAARLLSAACAVDVAALGAGEALRVMWRADGGGVRGTGVIVRVGPERFLLEGADVDIAWFERAGPRFGAKIEEGEGSRGSLYVAGQFADVMLKSCSLEAVAKLEPYRQLVYEWQGILVVASRWGLLNGVHIECAGVDAVSVFDRLLEAGRPYVLRIAGQEALELLALESGTPIPGLDFAPARSDDATEPSAAMLGLESGDAARVMRGVAWDGDGPATGTALFAYDPATRVVGEIARSAYSPALGAVICLCIVDGDVSASGTGVVLRVMGPHGATDIPARIAALPFLP